MPGMSWRTFARFAAAGASVVVLLAVGATEARGAPGAWTWPVRGHVSTPYSNDNLQPYAGGMHRGIDIAAPVGTPVHAAHGGQVTYAGAVGSAGLTVALRTTDGYATSYLHLSAIAVARGEHVTTGERVGEVGTTGERSAPEPHLHFGVRLAARDHFYVDPLSLLPPRPGQGAESPVPATVPASLPARAEPAPAAVPAGAPAGRPHRASEPQRHPVPRPVPAAHPQPGRDWSGVLGLAGAALVFCALFGAALLRALRDAGSVLGERLRGRAKRVPYIDSSPWVSTSPPRSTT
jgi:Peptidase family M23